MTATTADWIKRQHRLNLFTSKYVGGVGSLREDGDPGPATKRRIQEAKWWLGWRDRTTAWSDNFAAALRDPRSRKYSQNGAVARGIARRTAHRARQAAAARRPGVTKYDGVPCANWLVPYLNWARDTGHNGVKWMGTLTSGFRDPVLSEHLCRAMCGAPQCPGKCAGRSSNHSGKVSPKGALDVSDYVTFGELMPHCPLTPKLQNQLGAADPVHFSATGH
jgi:hypothetical protein